MHTIKNFWKTECSRFLAEFYENIWVLLENLELSFSNPGTEFFDFAQKTSLYYAIFDKDTHVVTRTA